MIHNLLNLKKKVVIITGGTGHLGKSIVESLINLECNVVLFARNLEKVNDMFGDKVNVYIGDIGSSVDFKKCLKKIFDNYGRIDAIINIAFYTKSNKPEIMTDEEWKYTIDGTLNSTFYAIREAIPYLKKSNGTIINFSSMYGVVCPDFKIYDNHPNYFNPASYGVAKSAVIHLTKYYAKYLAKSGIRVNCVVPGAFPNLSVQKNKDFINELKDKIPMGRIGKPEDLNGTIIFLLSDMSKYITGQSIIVDGGWTI